MVLQHGLVVVSETLSVSHGYQEGVVDSRVRDVGHKASEEGCHDVQVGEVGHQLALLDKVVEAPGDFN